MHQQERLGPQNNAKGLAHLLRLDWTRACRRRKRETLLHQNWYTCAPLSVQSEIFYVEKMHQHLIDPDTKVEITIIMKCPCIPSSVRIQMWRLCNGPTDDFLAPDQSGGPNIG